MVLKSSRHGDVVLIDASGLIDTRASGEFEKQLLEVYNQGGRAIAIDLSKVDLITSAGIRVLVMLAQRLHGVSGAMMLCALGPKVRTVFEVSGLMRQFKVAATPQEAIAALSTGASAAAAAPPAGSKLSRLARHLLGGDNSRAAGRQSKTDAISNLSSHVADLLDKDTH